jgi:hypothetical protein
MAFGICSIHTGTDPAVPARKKWNGATAMKTHLWLLVVFGLGVTACAGGGASRAPASQPPLYPPAVFAHRVGTSEITVYWNCARPEPDVLRVEGVVQNTGGGSIQYAEVEIVSVDARDRAIASVGAPVRDAILQTNQISPFQLTLRMVGAEARIDLYYVYRAQTRFGFGVGQAYREQFRARDVCSESQHRVPKPQ